MDENEHYVAFDDPIQGGKYITMQKMSPGPWGVTRVDILLYDKFSKCILSINIRYIYLVPSN